MGRKILGFQGFSLLELLSAASIAAVLAVVGIKSYQSQVNKAKTAEAQESLSYVYSTQQVFYNNWNSYHENLMIVGTIPSGNYNYDVGFTVAGHNTGGDLADFPSKAKPALTVTQCSTFKWICEGECLTQVNTVSPGYFGPTPNCEVVGRQNILKKGGAAECTDTKCSATATTSAFKAIATEKLNSLDIWSIDQNQQLLHEKDGT